jgi:hypothetical protein
MDLGRPCDGDLSVPRPERRDALWRTCGRARARSALDAPRWRDHRGFVNSIRLTPLRHDEPDCLDYDDEAEVRRFEIAVAAKVDADRQAVAPS